MSLLTSWSLLCLAAGIVAFLGTSMLIDLLLGKKVRCGRKEIFEAALFCCLLAVCLGNNVPFLVTVLVLGVATPLISKGVFALCAQGMLRFRRSE